MPSPGVFRLARGEPIEEITDLRGTAVFDLQSARFTSFAMVAVGWRWGGSRFNLRSKELERSMIGVVFELAPAEMRVPPAHIKAYHWQGDAQR